MNLQSQTGTIEGEYREHQGSDPVDIEIATWELDVTNKYIKITFDRPEAFSNLDGTDPKFDEFDLKFEASFDKDKIGDSNVAQFQLDGIGEIVINFEDDGGDEPVYNPSVTKEGGDYNPYTKEITWTVTVDSGLETQTLKDVVVKDTLPVGQGYV